ncbi:MAG TPA: penicillin-binding protein 2 [Blastocatellia bacterium]|nr:penicillin-binding protein 2 [Blastocatellia bacterium]
MSSNKNPKEETHNFGLRLYSVQYLVLVIIIALGIRFYFLQVTRHEEYKAQAENNRIREIPIPAPRGAILDREGRPLVDNTPAWNIVVFPEDIKDKDETIRALVENLNIDRDELLEELNDPMRPKSQPVIVKQKASHADLSWVFSHELEHPEITAEQQPQRVYPYGTLAAHVLGYIGEISPKQLEKPEYAGYKQGDIIGQGGLEAVYDKILRGVDGKRRIIVDSHGRPRGEIERIEPIKGQDIVTTLDLDIQKAAEEQFYSKHDTGAAIAMDPRNGEILAMVSVPSFDPNVFAQNVISSENRKAVRAIINDPAKPLFNKAIQSIYPTGSTWKILMATAALEEGIITPKNSRLVCGGGIAVGNRFVHCGGNHGSPDIHVAIVKSCDGYFYRLGLKLGVDKINEWVTKFGMGQKTGIDLPHEERGIIPSREWKKKVNPADPVWKDFDTVIASIGQGSVAVPPMQLLRAEAGIINGGHFHTPHFLKEAKATKLKEVQYYEDTKAVDINLSPVTVETVTYGMWGVVNEGGTAGGVGFPKDLNIGGKTGTAQVIAKEKVRGKEHKDHSWFISFAPMHTDQPAEIGVVCITENGGWGATASAPKVKMIMGTYWSKKLGRPVLPELVAQQTPPNPNTLASTRLRPAVDAVRRRTVVQ